MLTSAPADPPLRRRLTATNVTELARDLGLVALGTALTSLAMPPKTVPFLGLIAWVPLACIASSGRPGRAALLGWLHGAVSQAAALAGVSSAIHQNAGSTVLASGLLALALVVFDGGRFALVALAAAKASQNGWPLIATFPVALVAGELVYPMFFPWYSFIFFQDVPVLLQGAAWGGPLLLSFLMGIANASIAVVFCRPSSPRSALCRGVLVPGVLLAATALLGELRIRSVERAMAEAPTLRLGIVQADVQPDANLVRDIAASYRAGSLELLRSGSVDLLVWPEAAIFPPAARDDLSSALRARAFGTNGIAGMEPIRVPILAGALLRGEPSLSAAIDRMEHWRERSDPLFNSAVLASSDGTVIGIYDKQTLVPFGEYVPWETKLPWLRRWVPRAGRFSQGTSPAPMTFGLARIQVLICFEDILVEPVRSQVRAGRPNLLIDLASDAWFGASRVPWFHVALARLRAVEHGRFLVHATTDGVSAIIDAAGRVTTVLPAHRPAHAAANVALMSWATPYDRLGDAPWWTMVMLLALPLAVRRRGSD